MKITKYYQLERHLKRAAEIQQELETHRRALLALPQELGYKSMKTLIQALHLAQQDKLKDLAQGIQKTRKSRTIVTPALMSQVRKLVHEGRKADEISHNLHISIATVQNIKRKLGLVRKVASISVK